MWVTSGSGRGLYQLRKITVKEDDRVTHAVMRYDTYQCALIETVGAGTLTD